MRGRSAAPQASAVVLMSARREKDMASFCIGAGCLRRRLRESIGPRPCEMATLLKGTETAHPSDEIMIALTGGPHEHACAGRCRYRGVARGGTSRCPKSLARRDQDRSAAPGRAHQSV